MHIHLTCALNELDLFSTLSGRVWETQLLVLLFGGLPLWGGLSVSPGVIFTCGTSQVGMCGQVPSSCLPSPPRDFCELGSHFPTRDVINHCGPTSHKTCSSAWPSRLMDCERREAENKLCARLLVKPGLHSLISLKLPPTVTREQPCSIIAAKGWYVISGANPSHISQSKCGWHLPEQITWLFYLHYS